MNDALVNYALGLFDNRVLEDVEFTPTTFAFTVIHPHDAVSFMKLAGRLSHKGIKDVVMRPARISYNGKAWHGTHFTIHTEEPDAETARLAENLRNERRHKGPSFTSFSTEGIPPADSKMMTELFHSLYERHPIDGTRAVPFRTPERFGFYIIVSRPPTSTTATPNANGALSIHELTTLVDFVKRTVGASVFDDVVVSNSANIPALSTPSASTTTAQNVQMIQEGEPGIGKLCLRITMRTTVRKRLA